MINLAEKNGFKLIKNKTSSTPKESILYGYPFSSEFENQVFIFKLSGKNKKNSDVNILYNNSFWKFICLAFISDIFLRLIITSNYLVLLNKNIKSFLKSIFLCF